MRIELDDHIIHIDRVQKMIEYFDILDHAGIEEDELMVNQMPLGKLRADKFIPFDGKLIEHMKNYKGRYVRAPKMV